MPKNDTHDFQFGDVQIALSLLTRLPLSPPDWDQSRPAASAAWAYPVAGMVVAFVAALVSWLCLWLGMPASVAAGAALVTLIVTTGAMHEDGLADSTDGLWGGWDRERRLEIMKDSRIGAYGVIALVLALLLRWSAISTAFAAGHVFWPLLVSAALSRAAMVWVMDNLPNARDNGLSHQTGQPGSQAVRVGATGAVILAVLGFGWSAIWLILAAALAMLAIARIARAKIGGQTGDILGASQQLCEIAVLAMITTLV